MLASDSIMLGGRDFTSSLVEFVQEKIPSNSRDAKLEWKIIESVANAKHTLSIEGVEETCVDIDLDTEENIEIEVSREKAERVWSGLLDRFSSFVGGFLSVCSGISSCEICGGGMLLWCVKQRLNDQLLKTTSLTISLNHSSCLLTELVLNFVKHNRCSCSWNSDNAGRNFE